MFPYKSHSCLISFALVISTGEPECRAVVAAFRENVEVNNSEELTCFEDKRSAQKSYGSRVGKVELDNIILQRIVGCNLGEQSEDRTVKRPMV